jgi:uncharacterized Zn finger protein (UPF0148 family)
MRQMCMECGTSVRLCGGVFCASCRREKEKAAKETSNQRRAEFMLRFLKKEPEAVRQMHDAAARVDVQVSIPVLASVAADQLAQAWGVRRKK